jgi:HK97 family phage major capsid protein
LNDVNAPVQVIGTSFSALDFDDLNQAIYKVATPVISSGKFYFHPTMLGVLQRIKDQEDNYIWRPGPNGVADGTIWGRPYVLTEVLPALSATANNTDFMVYGDAQQFEMVIRKGLTVEVLREGTVGTGDDSVNLASQDAKALRAVSRMDGRVIFPSAFCIFRTGTAS